MTPGELPRVAAFVCSKRNQHTTGHDVSWPYDGNNKQTGTVPTGRERDGHTG